jgi:hypothetical protein
MPRLRSAARSLGQLAQIDPVDLALRLTLLDLLLRPIGDWRIRPALLAIAGAGLLIPGWLRRPPLWFALAGLTALRFWIDWPLADNHAYLISYWCLAAGISLAVRDTEACLALNGRLLIGLAFAFAVLWKWVLSPDFMDGTFLRVTMLQDPRFEDWTLLSSGLSVDQLETHRAALDRHLDSPPFAVEPGPALSARFLWLADATTFWTAGIELALAAAFLWWKGGALSRARDALLIAFCATTYAVATVDGFGWLLISMGVAQCDPRFVRTKVVYVASFALILVYREVPWAGLVADALGGAGP